MTRTMRDPRRWSLILALLLSLPFLDKAYHIDDANFLHLAEQAQQSPLGLYHAAINWGGSAERAFDVLSNPPGVAWWLALVRKLGGSAEWLAHLSLWPFLAMTLEGMRRLAQRFLPEPEAWGDWPALLLLFSPALFLASQTMMPELPLVGCYALGLALTLEGYATHALRTVICGSLLAGAAALFRYSGLTVLPLLLLYGVLFRPARRLWWLSLLLVALPSVLWAALSTVEYGRPHLLAMVGFQTEHAEASFGLHKGLYQLTSLGLALVLPGLGVLLGVLFGALFGVSWGGVQQRTRRVWGLGGLALGGLGGLTVALHTGVPTFSCLLLVLGMGLGGAVLGWALEALRPGVRGGRWRRLLTGRGGQDAELCFLACWLLGVLLFNQSLRFASVRYLLPGAVPALLLVLRRGTWASHPLWLAWACRLGGGLGLLVSLALASADQQLANAYRAGVERLPPLEGTRYFVGHWGMQYYLERAGALPLSEREPPLLKPGDQLVSAGHPWPQQPEHLPPRRVLGRWPVTPWPGLWTVSLEGRGCFYAFLLAPGPTPAYLPFAWGSGELDALVLEEVVAQEVQK
ncbi:MAG: hypothetical protein ACKO6N_09190 [Myxococcota bacterium]